MVPAPGQRRNADDPLGSILEKRGGPWTYGYLLRLGVHPLVKRRGLGRRLIEALTLRFIDSGARIMLADTEDDNLAALTLFRSVGFGRERPHVSVTRNLTHHPEYLRRRGDVE